jgi:hypothetical protein
LNESLRASGGGNSLGAKILATTKIWEPANFFARASRSTKPSTPWKCW